jgi:hypothetical protein
MTKMYRGFRIEAVDATQLGYRLPGPGGGRPGKGRKVRGFHIYDPEDPDRPIKTVESMKRAIEYIDNYLGPEGAVGEPRFVADFNTLDDLVQHAATDLGATHVAGDGAHTRIYFPRGGLYPYEEAKVWRKGGYWHAEGPHARTGVSGLPSNAKPIGRAQGRRAAEYAQEARRGRGATEWIYVEDLRPGDVIAPTKEEGGGEWTVVSGPVERAVQRGEYTAHMLEFTVRSGQETRAVRYPSESGVRVLRQAAGATEKHVEDYVAYDRDGRPVGAPFEHYGDARSEAERAGGHVEFVPRRRGAREANMMFEARPSKQLEDAVRAFQLYHGSEGMRIRDQQKLYDRSQRAAERIAKSKGMSVGDVVDQLDREARRRGPVIPIPGKDI